MRTEVWKVILLASVPATAAAVVAGPELRPLVVSAVSVVSLILIFSRTRQLPPGSKVAWFTFGLAGSLMLLGAIVRTIHGEIIGIEDPLPSPADVLFASGYGLLIVGEIHFLRARSSEPDRDAWIDALIISAAVGLMLWTVLIGPYVRDPSAPFGERITNALYLLLTLSLIAATVRLTAAPGVRAPSYYLLAGAVATFFLNDLLGTVAYARGGDIDILLVLTPLTYAFFCAALYHPSVVRLTQRPKHVEPRLSVGRLVMLATALMIPPSVLIYELNVSIRPADQAVIVSAAFIMAVLVLVRLARLVRARERLADREHALRRALEDLASAATPEEVHDRAASAAKTLPASAEVEAAGTVVVVDGQPRLMASRGGSPLDGTLEWPLPDPSDEADGRGAVRRLHESSDGVTYAAPFAGSGPTEGALVVRTDEPLDRHDRRSLETLARETALALRGLHGAEIHHRQRSEKRFRSLVQNSADIVAVVKPGTG